MVCVGDDIYYRHPLRIGSLLVFQEYRSSKSGIGEVKRHQKSMNHILCQFVGDAKFFKEANSSSL
jgi:hypothetical protein